MITLSNIQTKYSATEYNTSNFHIGGGLSEGAFASNRHQDAKFDEGKLTLGEATSLFKKATKKDTAEIKAIILYSFPNLEWHHAGKLPKAYGGGMGKTYYVNADEIAKLAANWENYAASYEKYSFLLNEKLANEKNLAQRQNDFLIANCKEIIRETEKPFLFHQTKQEMNGKYGWFDSTYKSYNMTEYYSGWEFPTVELYNAFFQL